MSQSNTVRRLELVGGNSAAKLPQYMHRRGETLYFKRKIPADAAEAFPGYKEQVWKSLETDLLSKAKIRLAVEVTEFNLTLAAFRRKKAAHARDQEGELASGLTLVVSRPVSEPVSVSVAVPTACQAEPSPPAVVASLPNASTRAAAKPQPAKAAALPAQKEPGPSQTMLHLLESWKRTQTRHRTINAYEAAVLEFRELHGPIPVDAITRPMARAYRDQLVEQGLSRGTIENRIGFLSTLVRHGMTELVEHMVGNPFERIEILGAQGLKPNKNRRAYEVWELNQLYASELYTKGYRPEGQSFDAAYWLPLLGPFVGGRIEEICQLAVADIQSINGTWCLRVCNLDEDQKLKNEGSFRRVPLHEQVIKCGFLVYVAKVAAAGHRRVFPTLSNRNANKIYSNSPGKWYGRYCDRIGLTDRRLDYHSFRYSMK